MNNPLAVISVVAGTIALMSNVCNCIPILNWVAWILIPLLAIAAIVTGGIGITKANEMGGEGKPLAIAGAGLGCMSLVVMAGLFALVFFGFAAFSLANQPGF